MRREQKQFKKKHGMRVSGRSNFVIQNIIKAKTEQIKKERAEKNFPTGTIEIGE